MAVRKGLFRMVLRGNLNAALACLPLTVVMVMVAFPRGHDIDRR